MWYALLAKMSPWRGVWAALVSADSDGWNVVSRGGGGVRWGNLVGR